MLALTTLLMMAAAPTNASSSKSEDAQVRRWLASYFKSDRDDDDLQNLVYGYALVDLNGDGRNEAVVWARDSNLCGTSGCGLEIFEHGKTGWRLLADGPTTRPPIRLLPIRTNGWSDLSGWQYGGGDLTPFRSWIRFDGRDYAWSKTSSIVPRHVRGRIIIKDATVPLFPRKCRPVKEAPSVFGPIPVSSDKAGNC